MTLRYETRICRRTLVGAWLALLLAAGLAVSPALPIACGEDDTLETFVAGLRQRRLFALADEYCRQQLSAPSVEPSVRGRLTVEWMRVLAEQAMQSPAAERRGLTKRCRQLAADFAHEQPQNPRLLLVQVQDALSLLAVGEVVRREAELSGAAPGDAAAPGAAGASDPVAEPTAPRDADDRSGYAEARSLLRDGLRLIDLLDRELAQLIPQRFRRPLPPPALSGDELATLDHHLKYQQVRAQRQVGLCFPPDSTDRIAALATARQTAEKTLTGLPPHDPLGPQLRLERAILLRLLDKRDEAHAALAESAWTEAPPESRLAARAELIRLVIAVGQTELAERLVEESPDERQTPSAELDFARLEYYLARWKGAEAARATDEAERWERQALAAVERVDQRHGPAWRRRGDLLVVRAAIAGRGPRSREALRRSGDHFYEQGRLDDAVSAYDQAADQARNSGDDAEQFVLRYRAALVEQKRGQHAAAARRLAALADDLPTQTEAPVVNQLAAWNLAQSLRDPTGDKAAEATNEYRKLLERQIERWPEAEATQQARVWLGRLCESRREWSAAADAYRGIPASSPHYAAALEGAGRAWLARIEQLQAKPSERRAEAEAAGRYFEQAAYGTSANTLDRWTEPQRAAALVAARAWLEPGVGQLARAERLLRSALDRSTDADESWQLAAKSLLLVALAGQETRQAAADELVDQIGRTEATVVADAALRVAQLRQAAAPDALQRLAKLELRLIASLSDRQNQLADAMRAKLALSRAVALVAIHERDAALAAYRELVKSRPRDATVQESFAQLLLDGDDADQWRESLDRWRRIAAQTPPRGDRWYRAKYGVALAEYKLGQRQEAAQLIRFLQATPPGLANTPLAAQFAELLRRCQE